MLTKINEKLKKELDKKDERIKDAENTLIKIDNWNDDMATYNPGINDCIKEYFGKYKED